MKDFYQEIFETLSDKTKEFLTWFGIKNSIDFLSVSLDDFKHFPIDLKDKELLYENLENELKKTGWNHAFYFVAAPRKGLAPTLEKAVDGKLFLSYSEAETFCKKISWEQRFNYKVFCALGVIPRIPPVDKEVIINIKTFMEIDSIVSAEEFFQNEDSCPAEIVG